jgi:hypothetical protein
MRFIAPFDCARLSPEALIGVKDFAHVSGRSPERNEPLSA